MKNDYNFAEFDEAIEDAQNQVNEAQRVVEVARQRRIRADELAMMLNKWVLTEDDWKIIKQLCPFDDSYYGT